MQDLILKIVSLLLPPYPTTKTSVQGWPGMPIDLLSSMLGLFAALHRGTLKPVYFSTSPDRQEPFKVLTFIGMTTNFQVMTGMDHLSKLMIPLIPYI